VRSFLRRNVIWRSAMRAPFSLSAVVSGAFLVVGVQGIRADTLQFHIQNLTPYRMELQFQSETTGGVWPGNGRVYIQADSRTYDYTLACSPREKICFGASARIPQGTYFWGVDGPTRTCTNCCWICGDDAQLEQLTTGTAAPSYAAAPPSNAPVDPDPVGTSRLVQQGMNMQMNNTITLMHAMSGN
jgi:hypothetical protein